MKKEDLLIELAHAVSVDGKVNVDMYVKIVGIIDRFTSIDNSIKPRVNCRLYEIKYHSNYAVWDQRYSSFAANTEDEALTNFWVNKNKEDYEVMSVRLVNGN